MVHKKYHLALIRLKRHDHLFYEGGDLKDKNPQYISKQSVNVLK